jgi:TRAP-type uncharacterized transport system substrate-binding protein
MAVRAFLRKYWPVFTVIVTAAVIACVAIALLYTLPPRKIVMVTGAEGGAYYELGKRYRDELAKVGVHLLLVPTTGSSSNLALLLDRHSGVSIGLIQGGTDNAAAADHLESLGTLFYEPLWLFRRPGLLGEGFKGLRGLRISVGPLGSGTRELSLELLRRNGIDEQVSELLALPSETAVKKLLAGEIDVMLAVNAWESPMIQKLLADDRVEVASFPRADADVALYPFLSKVVVPKGVGDLAKDLPPADVTLIAPKASLVVRKDLHPAIQYLLLNAAVKLNSGPGIFQRAGQFPAAEAFDIPLSSEALQFYKSGQPFLHNYLPFWMAELSGKLIVLLIPVLGLLYPMMRFLPSAYNWMMRSKILRLYGELKFLEDEIIHAARTGPDTAAIIARLDHLKGEVDSLRLPVAYMSMLYFLRNHIDLVRGRLRKNRPLNSQRGH